LQGQINNKKKKKKENDLLRNIPLMRMEAKSALHQISYLLNNKKYNLDKELDRILDRIKCLNELEAELLEKQEREEKNK
jgi:hypothetical protein